MSKRVLVTGGAGFIGSYLCAALLKERSEVICVDNISTGRESNIAPLFDYAGFTFLRRDILDPLDIEVDEIYNLASPASPPQYQLDPVRTLKTNTIGVLNVLELARTRNAKIFQASTSEIYGDSVFHPQNEVCWGNVNPVGVRSPYAEGKRCAEAAFFSYFRQYSVKIKVARIFNIYGPRMSVSDGRVIPNFISSALRNEEILIYGDGSQTRSFCFIDDFVEGAMKFMLSDDQVTGPINIGNPEEITIRNLAALIVKLTGSTSKFVSRPLPRDDPSKRLPDITTAHDILGWTPTTDLRGGLVKTIELFHKSLSSQARSNLSHDSLPLLHESS